MINVALSHNPNLDLRVDDRYLRNFNLALLNWELNRKEDRKVTPKKGKRPTK